MKEFKQYHPIYWRCCACSWNLPIDCNPLGDLTDGILEIEEGY